VKLEWCCRTKPEEAVCVTSTSDRQRSGKLRMKFDKGDRTFDKELFEYVEDPTIESAESGVAGQVSGNIGTHLVL